MAELSANSVVLLNALLDERDKLREGPPLPADEAFELFTFEQALKEEELSAEEVAQGRVGGGQDGGVDGLFTFLNGNLVEEDADVLEDTFDPRDIRAEPDLVLTIVQSKQSESFAETPFEKLQATLSEMLELSRTEEQLLKLFSEQLIQRFGIFRQAWQKLATRHPKIHVRFVYATKGDTSTKNAKVDARAERLIEQVKDAIPKASATIEFLGARELIDLAGREKSYTLKLDFRENATDDKSHVALVSLDDYYDFITDDANALRRYIFDWNVRDYEGDVEVNREITQGLADGDSPEFWWLNNGVTVICSQASSTGRTFSLDDVQIVNGLQTSVTIYEYLKAADRDDPARQRSVLVRIIVTGDFTTRDRVIRATNRQTAVQPASLRATDQIQRDLEQYFLQHEWFYERRKNYYRNQGRPAARIVTIPYLAQAIMAIGLSEPNNSRARPSSLLKRESDYTRVFDPDVDFSIYLWIAQLQKGVDEFLRSDVATASALERTNLRFYVGMLTAAGVFGAKVYHPSQLKEIVGKHPDDAAMFAALQSVRLSLDKVQKAEGGQVDKIAKGSQLTDVVLADALES